MAELAVVGLVRVVVGAEVRSAAAQAQDPSAEDHPPGSEAGPRRLLAAEGVGVFPVAVAEAAAAGRKTPSANGCSHFLVFRSAKICVERVNDLEASTQALPGPATYSLSVISVILNS